MSMKTAKAANSRTDWLRRSKQIGVPLAGSTMLGAMGFLITMMQDMQDIVITKEQVIEIQEVGIEKIMKRFDALERKVDGHHERLGKLETRVDVQEGQVRELTRTVEDCFHDLREGRELRAGCD